MVRVSYGEHRHFPPEAIPPPYPVVLVASHQHRTAHHQQQHQRQYPSLPHDRIQSGNITTGSTPGQHRHLHRQSQRTFLFPTPLPLGRPAGRGGVGPSSSRCLPPTFPFSPPPPATESSCMSQTVQTATQRLPPQSFHRHSREAITVSLHIQYVSRLRQTPLASRHHPTLRQRPPRQSQLPLLVPRTPRLKPSLPPQRQQSLQARVLFRRAGCAAPPSSPWHRRQQQTPPPTIQSRHLSHCPLCRNGRAWKPKELVLCNPSRAGDPALPSPH